MCNHTETGTYYLRARYYDPRIGRFTQQDTHWNTSNIIYGDNPQKINEREDKLGLKTYSYAPQISAVVQSGNLYVYAVGNPVMYYDYTGDFATRGQIHDWVLKDIANNYQHIDMRTNKMIDYEHGWGFADLVSFKTGEVWEVKRCTLSIEKAKKQLKKYTDHTLHDSYYKSLKLETGGSKGTVIESNHITRTAGETTYNITYWYQGDGIILYDYTTNINKEVVGVEVASAAIIAVGVVLTIITGGAAAPSIVLVF